MDFAFNRKLNSLWVLLWTTLSLSGCMVHSQIGARPSAHLMTSVEAYLQQYQPGPKPRLFQTTFIYDRNGALIAELYPEGRRTWISLSGMSQHLIDATLATEDASFYRNPGVDIERLISAAIQNAQNRSVVSGASTITMQLARNLFMGTERRYDQSLDRKIAEIGIAQELTDLFTKDEILEIYFNLINYGNLNYGPEAAAQFYFGKSAADLDLAEASLLAGIPRSPAYLDPIKNIYAVKQRQRVVLDLMVRHHYLSAEEAAETYQRPLRLLHSYAGEPIGQPINKAPHFTQHVLTLLAERLGQAYVARSGLRIVTTLDLTMQETAQQIVSSEVARLKDRYGLNNAALVAVKPGTAEVLAMVGSAAFHDPAIDGQVNVATSLRQPGSTIKPLIYAAAIDDGLIAADSIIRDEAITYQLSNGSTYAPQNFDRKYHGPVTIKAALANSYNVPAVKVLERYGVEQMVPRLQAMGLRSLQKDGYHGLSLALGSAEVTLLELCAGYHVLVNHGIYREPRFILTMIDPINGSSVTEEAASETPVISPESAFTITRILSDAGARAPTFGSPSALELSRPAAAKTGTTSSWRDNLTVGYTRHLVAGVWAGNTDGRPTQEATGIVSAGAIWHRFMEAVLADPAMLTTLDASQEKRDWQFQAPQAAQ